MRTTRSRSGNRSSKAGSSSDPGQLGMFSPGSQPPSAPPSARKRRKAPEFDRLEEPSQVVHAGPRFEEGPMFRAKRVALGLSVNDMGLTRRQAVRLAINEDGFRDVDWGAYAETLQLQFEARVASHLTAGGDPWELRLNPWSMREIMDAVRAIRQGGWGGQP